MNQQTIDQLKEWGHRYVGFAEWDIGAPKSRCRISTQDVLDLLPRLRRYYDLRQIEPYQWTDADRSFVRRLERACRREATDVTVYE